MSIDPYHAVQSDVQTSLQTAANLRASLARIRSTASSEGNEELQSIKDEVRWTLISLYSFVIGVQPMMHIGTDCGYVILPLYDIHRSLCLNLGLDGL